MAQFYIPTRVLQGNGIVRLSSVRLAALGQRALVVTGTHSAKQCGALNDLLGALDEHKIEHLVFNEVEVNPSASTCQRAAVVAREFKADFVVGIGGGSPLDAAKVIAILAKNEIDDEALYSRAYPDGALPVVAIPTTAGTGSEVTPYAILTDDAIQSKRNVSSEHIFPVLALLDGRYIESLPREVMINTTIDALSHALEGYLTRRGDVFSRSIALSAMRMLSPGLHKLARNESLESGECQELLSSACLAGMVIAHTGTTAVHALGYSLTYFKGFAHGRANGVLLGPLLDFVSQEMPQPVRDVLDAMHLEDLTAFYDLIASLLGRPESLSDAEKGKFADIAMNAPNRVNTLRIPERDDLIALLDAVF